MLVIWYKYAQHIVALCMIAVQDKWTALHVAARNGHTAVVEILIKAGADVNVASTVCIASN